MSIVARGPANILVIQRNGVPLKEICDAVAEHKLMSWIKTRYNITNDELFDCLDTYADLLEKHNQNALTLEVIFNVNNRIAAIETMGINDRMYFSVLCYSRKLFPNLDSFKNLYVKGMKLIIVEVLMDVKHDLRANIENRPFMHGVALAALEKAIERTVDHTNVQDILDDLDYMSVLEEVSS
jgi:hypothetical protein